MHYCACIICFQRNVCDKAILAKVERFNPFDTDTDNQQLDHEQSTVLHIGILFFLHANCLLVNKLNIILVYCKLQFVMRALC